MCQCAKRVNCTTVGGQLGLANLPQVQKGGEIESNMVDFEFPVAPSLQ